MNDYITVSFSGGKDSTAMLLHMIEIGEQINEVLNVDVGMEFPLMYDHIEKVRKVVEDHGIKFTVLRADHSFEYYMFEHEINSKKYGPHKGHGWPTPVIRWCTGWMKRDVLNAYLREIRQEYNLIQCIGLAADEQARLQRENNKQSTHRHPLNEWGWTEADCLEYCYSHGYDWGGLYKIFKRVSCWCCPLQSISELRNLHDHFPELWDKLQGMEDRLLAQGTAYKNAKFREDWTVAQLSRRFEREAKAVRDQRTLLEWIPE